MKPVFLDGNYYKVGLRGMVFRECAGDWVHSGKPRHEVDAAIKARLIGIPDKSMLPDR